LLVNTIIYMVLLIRMVSLVLISNAEHFSSSQTHATFPNTSLCCP